jgi:hypothetical protein
MFHLTIPSVRRTQRANSAVFVTCSYVSKILNLGKHYSFFTKKRNRPLSPSYLDLVKLATGLHFQLRDSWEVTPGNFRYKCKDKTRRCLSCKFLHTKLEYEAYDRCTNLGEKKILPIVLTSMVEAENFSDHPRIKTT